MRIQSMWLGFSAVLAGTLTMAALRSPHPTRPTPAPIGQPVRPLAKPAPRPHPLADSVVALAHRLIGTDYCYAGTTPEAGFDCSGFVTYVFSRVGIAVPHSSDAQAQTGQFVARTQARPGDIVIFTGTDPARRSPGHAGIVISRSGQPLRFIHSSSARRERGVKISQVDSTRYEDRFLQVRRVIPD